MSVEVPPIPTNLAKRIMALCIVIVLMILHPEIHIKWGVQALRFTLHWVWQMTASKCSKKHQFHL